MLYHYQQRPMNHALSRLKRASSSVASGTSSVSGSGSGSRASTSQVGVGVDGHGNVLPAYNNVRQQGGGAALPPMAEKTLPPGAAAYSHPSTRWDQAQRERDELERAIKLSEEQEEVGKWYLLIT